jgi:Uma2 family endonuclease
MARSAEPSGVAHRQASPLNTMSTSTAPAAVPHRLLTIEELADVVGDTPGELIEGRFVPMRPTGWPHARVEVKVSSRLAQFVEAHALGTVLGGEAGIVIRRGPDTLRGADVAYVSNERLARASADGYLDVAPELIVEIVSPNDRWTEITAKLEDYFSIGVALVWLVDPQRRRVSCFRSPTDLSVLGPGESLTAEPMLPGFALPVAELFA